MKTTLLVLLLVTHSSGSQPIHTVSKISVQKHHNITIPCLYDQRYVSERKYVSSGGVLFVFSGVVTHSRMCVVDNQTEKVFTASLSSAEESDTGWYWCAVSTHGSDPHAQLYLEVIKGKARLQVSSQSVSGYEGGSVSVVCRGASLWCRIGGSCVGRDEGCSDKTCVGGDGEALDVSVRELKMEDSGWYFCSDGNYQMPVHISVRKIPYPRRVTVPPTSHTTALTQHNGTTALWRAVLGALPVFLCVAALLIRANIRRKRRAEAANPEGMNNLQLSGGNGKNEEVTCNSLYEKTGNEKNEEVTCANLYETTEIKQNMQGNEIYELVTCDDIYESMTGNEQNIQGNEKHKVEDLYESMTGIKQIIQLPDMDNKSIYESMVRKVQ